MAYKNQAYPVAAPYVVWEPETGGYNDVKDALHYEVGDRAYFHFEAVTPSAMGLLTLGMHLLEATGKKPNVASWFREVGL